MKRGIKITLIVVLGVIFGLLGNFVSMATVIQGVSVGNGVCTIYFSGNLKCNKIKLNNPPRIAIDLIGIDKCDGCNTGEKIVRDGNVIIKESFHSIKDSVYKLYGKPTFRVVFVFKNGTIPTCKIDRKNGKLKIIYRKNIVLNELRRISLRKFNDHELIVALLSKKPDFKIKVKNGIVYLTLFNVSPTPESIKSQELYSESNTVDSIIAIRPASNIVRYIIKLKRGVNVEKTYSDKEHVYIVLGLKNKSLAKGGKERNNSKKEGIASSSSASNNKKGISGKNRGILGSNKLISFNVRDAQLKDIFRVFSQISGLNFIIGSDVKGTLTMRLKDVPLNQAFEMILQQEGLVADRKGNIVIIETASKYQRQEMQQLKALKEKERVERMRNAVTKVINLNYITPDYAIKIINKLLYNGNNKGGFVVSDVKNNALICHDTPKNIAKIEKIIKMIDHQKKAVEIDARIVEISKNFERQLGIQWGGNYFNSNIGSSSAFIGLGGVNSPIDVAGGLPPQQNFSNDNFVVNLPATLSAAPTSAVSLALGNVNANYNLDLKLTMGEIEGYTKILSSPRIITLNNEPAMIESGQQIPYQETAGASGATSVSFKSATLSLEVTPHITKNNQVILNIKVKKDSPDYSHSIGGEPPINTNQVSTTVILKNGQTLVIGGLIQRTSEETVSGIPGLMRIPLLGWLFKTKRLYNPQTELYIFVTPHILRSQ